MREHHIAVSRAARYFALGEMSARVGEVWFVCHGYGQLAGRFLRHFTSLDDGSRVIVAPEGLSRFYLGEPRGPAAQRPVGASWMTREDRVSEIDDYVRYLDALYAAVVPRAERGPVRVTALGFSQGAATVSRWAALGTSQIDRVVLWGGELPPDLDLAGARARLRDVRFTVVYGTRDEFITAKVAEGIAARLREHGISHQVRTFPGGHELDETLVTEVAASG